MEALKQKLKSKENIAATTLCHLFCTDLPMLYKNANMDFLIFDLEHGSYSTENIGDMLFACRNSDLISVVRVKDCKYHCISKPLDMGADGILIPRVETIEQVETAISSMRFFPKGKKGAGGRGLLRKNETVESFNKNRLLFLQIESPLGIENLEKMLVKHSEEIAGILIGPSDMAITSGCGFNSNADAVVNNIRKTISICKKHKVSVGMYMEINAMRQWKNEGMNLFWVETELTLLAKSVDSLYTKFKDLSK